MLEVLCRFFLAQCEFLFVHCLLGRCEVSTDVLSRLILGIQQTLCRPCAPYQLLANAGSGKKVSDS